MLATKHQHRIVGVVGKCEAETSPGDTVERMCPTWPSASFTADSWWTRRCQRDFGRPGIRCRLRRECEDESNRDDDRPQCKHAASRHSGVVHLCSIGSCPQDRSPSRSNSLSERTPQSQSWAISRNSWLVSSLTAIPPWAHSTTIETSARRSSHMGPDLVLRPLCTCVLASEIGRPPPGPSSTEPPPPECPQEAAAWLARSKREARDRLAKSHTKRDR